MADLELSKIILPSMGKYYGNKLPEGKIQITAWTVSQEDIIDRMGDEKENPLESLRSMVENNVLWPTGFTYDDLLTTDHFFLLMQLRCLSLTNFMTVIHTCPKCWTSAETQLDLSKATVKVPDEDDTEMEPFGCFLPKKKVEISVRFLRVGDEAAADKYVKDAVVKVPAQAKRFIYARQISAVGGQSLKFDERIDFVSTLAMLDLEVFKNRLLKKQTGITGFFSATCDTCKTEDKTWAPPLHVRFFRPLSTDIDRAAEVSGHAPKGGKLSG